MVATDIPFENSLIKNRISQTKLIQNLRSNCGFGKGLNILSLPFQSFIKTHILATIFSLFITDKYDTAFLIKNLPELLWCWSIKVRNEKRPWFVDLLIRCQQSVRINLYLRLNDWAKYCWMQQSQLSSKKFLRPPQVKPKKLLHRRTFVLRP